MNSKQKKILNAIFVILCFILTIYYVFKGQNLSDIIKYMKSANPIYWFIGVLYVLGYIMTESIVMYYLLSTLDYKARFYKCVMYSFIGFFFSCITPSATGGQPVQSVVMKKDGIPLHISAVVLLVITLTYKMVLLFYAGIIILFKPVGTMKVLSIIKSWVYFGMFLNIIMIVFMLLLAVKPRITEKMVNKLFMMIAIIFKSQKIASYKDKVAHSMDNFAIKSHYIVTHKTALVKTLFMTFIQRTLLFLVTYLVFISFGEYSFNVIDITLIQSMISAAVDVLPLPGGMGATEHLFLTAFRPFLHPNIVLPTMIVSRGISYYTQLIISALVTGFVYMKNQFFRKEENHDRLL